MKNLAPSTTSRSAKLLLASVAAESVITAMHHLHGAHIYDDPSLLHVALVAIGYLTAAAVLTGIFLWRPYRTALALLGLVVFIIYVGVFGLFGGGYEHLLKDLLFLGGASEPTLVRLFGWTHDFVLPNDVVFESTGVLMLVAGGSSAYWLARLLGQALRAKRPSAAATPPASATPKATGVG